MPLDPAWAPVTKIYPDARPLRSIGEKKSRLLGWMEKVFCVNCGADGGMVTKDWAAHIFYLCDECARTHGHLPLLEVPEAVVKGAGPSPSFASFAGLEVPTTVAKERG